MGDKTSFYDQFLSSFIVTLVYSARDQNYPFSYIPFLSKLLIFAGKKLEIIYLNQFVGWVIQFVSICSKETPFIQIWIQIKFKNKIYFFLFILISRTIFSKQKNNFHFIFKLIQFTRNPAYRSWMSTSCWVNRSVVMRWRCCAIINAA